VVWGHEHESLPEPVRSGIAGCEITQPGSSVATSLTEGESIQKNIVLLEMVSTNDGSSKETQYRTESIPLSTVRPFV
jgi:double-strand break repair protein MRE11